MPWLALPDIRELDGKTAYETSEYTNELGLENSSARLLPEGTVALSRTASVGFVTVFGRPMATSQDFVDWVCGDELEPWFLAWALIASRDYLRSLSSGAIHKTIYVPTVQAFHICMPSRNEQRRIVVTLSERQTEVQRLSKLAWQQLEDFSAVPGALLSALIPSTEDDCVARGWRWVKLGELVDAIRGVSFASSAAASVHKPGTARILTASNIGRALRLESPLIWIPKDLIRPNQWLRPGDIVLCLSSGSRSVVGKNAVLHHAWEGSVGAFCCILRAIAPEHWPYIVQVLQSPQYACWTSGIVQGANIQNLRVSELLDWSLPLPPDTERRRIVAGLNEQREALEKARTTAQAQWRDIQQLQPALQSAAFSGAL